MKVKKPLSSQREAAMLDNLAKVQQCDLCEELVPGYDMRQCAACLGLFCTACISVHDCADFIEDIPEGGDAYEMTPPE